MSEPPTHLRVLPPKAGPACKLPAELLPARLVHVADVLKKDLAQSVLTTGRLELAFHKSIERIRDLTTLIAEESECCDFLGFEIHIPQGGDTLRLTILAPKTPSPCSKPLRGQLRMPTSAERTP